MAKSKEDIKYGTAQAKLSEDEALRVAYKAGTPLEAGKIADSEPIDLFSSACNISHQAAAEDSKEKEKDAAAEDSKEKEKEKDATAADANVGGGSGGDGGTCTNYTTSSTTTLPPGWKYI